MPAPHFLQPLLKGDASRWLLATDMPYTIVASRLEPAFDSKTRNRGLLGRDALDADTALVIAPSSAVHTFGMRFPIDVVFASRDGRILKIRHSVARNRIAFAWRAFAVIELAAGVADRTGLEPGVRLVLRQPDPRRPQ